MAAITVSGAGGRTFSDIGMGGQAFGPTAFDPFGYRPSYFENFGAGGFYPGGLGGGGGSSFVPPTYYYDRTTGQGGINFATNPVPNFGPPLPSIPGAWEGAGGAAGGTGVAPPPQGFVTNFVPVGGGAAGGSSGTFAPVIIAPFGGSAAGGTTGQTPGIAGPASGASGGAPNAGIGVGGVGSQGYGYGPGGYTSGAAPYAGSPGAYSANTAAALDLTGVGGGWSPGSHQSFGGIQQRGGRVPWTGPAFLHEGERVIPKGGTMKDANKPVKDFGWFPTPPSWGGFGSPGAGTSGGLQTGGGGGIRIPPIPIPPTIPPGFLPPNFQVPQIPAGWMSFVPPRFQQFF